MTLFISLVEYPAIFL